jgi:hypothetical protein
MLNGRGAHVPREPAHKTLVGVALVGVGLASSYAFAGLGLSPTRRGRAGDSGQDVGG